MKLDGIRWGLDEEWMRLSRLEIMKIERSQVMFAG